MISSEDPELLADLAAEVSATVRPGIAAFVSAMTATAENLVPNGEVDIVEWCFENIEIPESVSDRAGSYEMDFARRFIARLWQRDDVIQVDNIKIPRRGSTIHCAAGLLYNACHRGRDSIYFERSEGDAQDFHDKKLMPILENSPKLRVMKRPSGKHGIQDSWTDIILRNGAAIQLRSASNDGSFRGIKGDFLALDEVGSKEWAARGKNTEGSKVTLARRRAQEFAKPVIFVGGSPTLKGTCVISDEFSRSNRMHYFMPCPCCPDGADWIEFLPDVRRAEDRTTAYGGGIRYLVNEYGYPSEAWYECQQCGNRIEEKLHKDDMLEGGEFRATAVGEPGHFGIYTWAAHSQDPQMEWIHIARDHAAAEKDASKLQPFVNTVLAQAYDPPVVRSMEITELEQRAQKEDWGTGEAPAWAEYLFAGIDVQEGNSRADLEKDGRVEMVVVAAGANRRHAVIDHVVLSRYEEIDPETGEIREHYARPFKDSRSEDMIWEAVERTYKTADGRDLGIRRTFIDAGYLNKEVLEFAAQRRSKRARITAIRGAREMPGFPRKVLPPKVSFSQKMRREFLWIGTQALKNSLGLDLEIPVPGPKSWTFARKFGEAFYKSFLAEARVEVRPNVWTWKRVDERETGEVWDCTVYALAAEAYEAQENARVRAALARVDQLALQVEADIRGTDPDAPSPASAPAPDPAPEKAPDTPVNPGRRVEYEDLPPSAPAPRAVARPASSRRPNRGTSAVAGIW